MRMLGVLFAFFLALTSAHAEIVGFSSLPSGAAPIGTLKTANMNSTADQAIPVSVAKYLVTKITATNCSGTLAGGLAAGGVYSATAKGGSAIVAAGQVYTTLTATTVTLALTLAITTTSFNVNTLYFSLTTANGSAITCDIYVYGDALP